MAIDFINQENLSQNFAKYKEIAVVIIIIHFLIEFYVNMRQLNRLKQNNGIANYLQLLKISEEEFIKGKLYKKDKLQFSIIIDVLKTTLETVLLLVYYQPIVWNFAADILTNFGINSMSEFARAYTFLLIETVRSVIFEIPVDWYSSFVIEERHGFNKKTAKIFIYDVCVGFALRIGFSYPILYGFL